MNNVEVKGVVCLRAWRKQLIEEKGKDGSERESLGQLIWEKSASMKVGERQREGRGRTSRNVAERKMEERWLEDGGQS